MKMHYNMLYIKQIQNKLTILSFIPNMTKKIQGYRMLEASLKWQCHEMFLNFLFSLIQPIWAPDKQVKLK